MGGFSERLEVGRWSRGWRRLPGRPARCPSLFGVGLGLLSALVFGQPGQAQDGILTVRPHEMATGTRTAMAGYIPLDSFPGFVFYVPQQCVGTLRCPLVISPDGYFESVSKEWHIEAADRYGAILVGGSYALFRTADLDGMLTQALKQFAIDPDKIALIARGSNVLRWMRLNPQVFSRSAAIGAGIASRADLGPPSPGEAQGQYFLSMAIDDVLFHYGAHRTAAVLRDDGAAVKYTLSLKGHAHRREDYESAWQWLWESWQHPNPVMRRAPPPVTDSLPVLTMAALDRLMNFWTQFQQEPDSIAYAQHRGRGRIWVPRGRRPYLREVALPLGQDQLSMWMTDMAAVAAMYPSVAAALKAAGLTAKEADAYRAALISAWATGRLEKYYDNLSEVPPVSARVEPASALGQNVSFLKGHRNEMYQWRSLVRDH